MHWRGFLSFNSNLLHSNSMPCPMPGMGRSDNQDRLNSWSFGVYILLEQADFIRVINYDCDKCYKVQEARQDCLGEEKGRAFRDVGLWSRQRWAAVPGALWERRDGAREVAPGYVLYGRVGWDGSGVFILSAMETTDEFTKTLCLPGTVFGLPSWMRNWERQTP